MCSPNEKQVLENSVSIADAPHPRKRSNQSKQDKHKKVLKLTVLSV